MEYQATADKYVADMWNFLSDNLMHGMAKTRIAKSILETWSVQEMHMHYTPEQFACMNNALSFEARRRS